MLQINRFVGTDFCLHSITGPSRASNAGFFSGKSVVITGTFENYSRDQLKEIVRSQGGKSASSVSKNTDLLLAGEKAGSKLEKANDLGVEVLSEKDLSGKL